MKHLLSDRLLELGLDAARQPTADERDHLQACEACATALATERELTESLSQMPQAEVPAGFAARTRARFELAQERRHRRQTAWALLGALLLGQAAAAGVVWIGVINAKEITCLLAGTIENIVVLGHALVVVMTKLPFVPVMLTAALCVTTLIVSGFVGKLAAITAEAK